MKQTLVNLLLSYLRYFARKTLARNKPTIIGITGTAGKSSAREILAAILKDHFAIKMVKGNSETGVPLGILGIQINSLGFETPVKSIFDWLRIVLTVPFSTNHLRQIDYLVVEMGIDDPYPPKNMDYLLTIVKPDIAIFLNTFSGAVHSMQFEKVLPKDKELSAEEKREMKTRAIAAEKAKIITASHCKVGIYNANNEYVVETLSRIIKSGDDKHKRKLLSFGQEATNDISFTSYKVSTEGTKFTFSLKHEKEKFTLNVKNFALQQEYQETLASAILATLQTGLKLEQIKHSLEKNFFLPKSRSTLMHGIKDSLILDSSYNASRPAVEGMLDLLSHLKKHSEKRPIVFLFGDMRELGEESQKEHELVAKKLIGIVDFLYLVGPETRRYVLQYISQLSTLNSQFKEVRWFSDSKHAGEYLKENLPKHALVLVKGSQNTIFLEEAVKYILNDKNDSHKLCRQDDYWLKKKMLFFNNALPLS